MMAARYVVNPVGAQLVERTEDRRWSSPPRIWPGATTAC